MSTNAAFRVSAGFGIIGLILIASSIGLEEWSVRTAGSTAVVSVKEVKGLWKQSITIAGVTTTTNTLENVDCSGLTGIPKSQCESEVNGVRGCRATSILAAIFGLVYVYFLLNNKGTGKARTYLGLFFGIFSLATIATWHHVMNIGVTDATPEGLAPKAGIAWYLALAATILALNAAFVTCFTGCGPQRNKWSPMNDNNHLPEYTADPFLSGDVDDMYRPLDGGDRV